jgi:SAM-dependent methyltransferase
MHANCRLMFEKYARSFFKPGMRILEIGPDGDGGPSALKRLVRDASLVWETVDFVQRPGITHLMADENKFPLPSDVYDIVVSANVIEHVRKVWVWIKEAGRVCKPGGFVITLNPISWIYHPVPFDCWRIYPDGMRALYEEAELDVLESIWESLENPGYKRYIPGISKEHQGRLRRNFDRLFGKLGFPVERSYDSVTIGQKKRTLGKTE